jgi:hypothetical protein
MSEAWALDRVLFEPLSVDEEADARAQNGYFLPKEIFAAKQYRLVKVNIELLETDGELVIPLFDGEQLIAKSIEIEVNQVSGYLVWHGEWDEDSDQPSWEMFEKALADQGVNSEAARLIFNTYDQRTQVRIVLNYHERDEETGANLNPVTGLLDALSPCKVNRFAKYSSDPHYVRGASAFLESLDNEKSYRLEMLGMGGPYHVIYEIDPSRVMIPGNDMIVPGQPYQSGLTPEQDQRNAALRQEWDALKLTIGPNPHDALYELRIKEVRASDARRLQQAQQQQVPPVIQGCQTN